MQFLRSLYQACSPPSAYLPSEKSSITQPVICISGGADEVVDASYSWNGLQRGDTPLQLLQLTLYGSGKLRYKDREFVVSEGDAMLVHFPHDHHYYFPKGQIEPWGFIYFLFSGKYSCEAWKELNQKHGPVVKLQSNIELIHQMRGLAQLLKQPMASGHVNFRWSASIISMLLEPKLESQPASQSLARLVAEQIPYKLKQDLSVEKLAKMAGWSVFYFARKFKDELGLSPADYVRRMRMKKAAELLSHCNWTLDRIAEEVGVSDVNSFARTFKQEWGIAPGQYRRSGR